ncbi:MAG TPA: sigma-E processing peptidase SpoIIGA [Tissierellales bacterium]|nr:sigma-E processing peptidase SpoIIGA [Tissierellales bacterium]
MYIYAEYLLLENLAINYIILYVTRKVTRTNTKSIRLFIGALIGALYTLVLFFPSLKFMTKFSIKVLISILIIIIAFNPEKIRGLIKLISVFYLISFVFAGASLGIFFIITNEQLNDIRGFAIKDFSLQILGIGIFFSIALMKNIFKYYQKKAIVSNYLASVSISLNNKKVDFTALIDTGNSLKEPISDKPVIIAEYKVLKEILPVTVEEIYLKSDSLCLDSITDIMQNTQEEIRFRLIPFKSVGKNNGILLGFKPDEIVVVNCENQKKVEEDVLVAIYNNKLSSEDDYSGLLHPEILN